MKLNFVIYPCPYSTEETAIDDLKKKPEGYDAQWTGQIKSLAGNGEGRSLRSFNQKDFVEDILEMVDRREFSKVGGTSEVRIRGYARWQDSRLSRPHSLATNNRLLGVDTSPLHMIGVSSWCRSFPFPSYE